MSTHYLKSPISVHVICDKCGDELGVDKKRNQDSGEYTFRILPCRKCIKSALELCEDCEFLPK